MLDEGLHVFLEQAVLGTGAGFQAVQVNAQFTGEAPHRRAGVDLGEAGRRLDFDRWRWRRLGHRWRRRRDAFRLGHLRAERDGAERVGQLALGRGRSARRQQQDQIALREPVTDLDLDALHHAGKGRRHVHAGLVAFQGDQRGIGFDPVAGRNQDVRDRYALEIADVWHAHLARFAQWGGSGRGCGRCRLWRGDAFRDVQIQDQIALRELIADLDLNFAHRAGQRRRHFHGRLVAFQQQQRAIRFDAVTGGNQDVDDIDVLEIANIRHMNFFDDAHAQFSSVDHAPA